ncbi:MAG: tetratricopeptide repeat protein (plasmid) [Leptolyngbya sp. BL-A-14]
MKMIKITLILTACLFASELLKGGSVSAYTPRIKFDSGSGQVKLQRKNRTNWIPVSSGTEINDGDQILPDRGLTAKVKCIAQGEFVRVPSGKISTLSQVCINWISRTNRASTIDPATAGGVDTTIPYLIAPRHTLLVSNKPLLRWNQVSGATQYTVEVTGSSGTVWQTKTKDSQVLYAGKPLNSGEPYTVTIRTNTGKSSLDDHSSDKRPANHLDFRILRPSEASAISIKLSNDDTELLELVEHYSSYTLPESLIGTYHLPADTFDTYSLTGEAISLLEARIEKGKASPLIHRTLATLYRQIGLIRLAEAHYLQAIALFRGLEDLENQTLAQESLGWLYEKDLADPRQALVYFEQAKAGFSSLGDAGKIDRLQRKITQLKAGIEKS